MKKRLLIILAACFVLSVALFAFSACVKKDDKRDSSPQEYHNQSEDWSYDSQYHWKGCTVEGCNDENHIYMKSEHFFGGDFVCDECGYVSADDYIYISDLNTYRVIVSTKISGDIVLPTEYDGKPVTDVYFGTRVGGTYAPAVFPEITSITINQKLGSYYSVEMPGNDDKDYFPKLTSFTSDNDHVLNFIGCKHLETVYAPQADVRDVKGDNVYVTAAKYAGELDVGEGTVDLTKEAGWSPNIKAKVVNLDESITALDRWYRSDIGTLNAPGLTKVTQSYFIGVGVINAPKLEEIAERSFEGNKDTVLNAPNIKTIGSTTFENSEIDLVINHSGEFTFFAENQSRRTSFGSLNITADTVTFENTDMWIRAEDLSITAKNINIDCGLSVNGKAVYNAEENITAKKLSGDEIIVNAVKLSLTDEYPLGGDTATLNLEKLEIGEGFIMSGKLIYNVKEFERTVDKAYRSDSSDRDETELVIGEKVEVLPDLFSGYNKIVGFSFGSDCKLKTIKSHALSKFQLEEITLPDSVTMVEPYAFSESYLNKINHSDDLRLPYSSVDGCFAFNINNSWGGGSGYALERVDNVLYFDKVTAIGIYKGSDEVSLTELTLREGTKYIETSAFADIATLTSIVLPSTLKEIDENAFANCNISSVVIPASVTKVANNAFKGCSNLQTIDVLGDILLPEDVTDSALYKGQAYDGLYYKGTKVTGIADLTKKFIYIKDGTTAMAEDAFAGVTTFKAVYIPKTLKLVSNAFTGCSENAKYLFQGQFQGGTGIKISQALYNVDVDKNGFVYSVGQDDVTLAGYYGEQSEVTVPSEYNGKPVTIIGEQAFVGNTDITKVVIGDGVLNIYGGAFANCTKLKEVSISASVRMINNLAFSGCSGLKTVTLSGDDFNIFPIDYDPSSGAAPTATVSGGDTNLVDYLTSTYSNYLWIRNLNA